VVFSDLFSFRRKDDQNRDTGAGAPVYPTKALGRFVAALNATSAPILVDLGPVVGPNVTFFGEKLGCKIAVEDVSNDIDRHARDGTLADLSAFFSRRFPQESSSVDGILCWDVFDYLDKRSAPALAAQLIRLLRPGGVLLALFGTQEPKPGDRVGFTRHIVVDHATLQHRPYDGALAKQRPLPNRDIQRMFEPLRISEQFLLKTNMREVLLRKPSAGAADAGL
jgi:SAM-dependent methyltransferase